MERREFIQMSALAAALGLSPAVSYCEDDLQMDPLADMPPYYVAVEPKVYTEIGFVNPRRDFTRKSFVRLLRIAAKHKDSAKNYQPNPYIKIRMSRDVAESLSVGAEHSWEKLTDHYPVTVYGIACEMSEYSNTCTFVVEAAE